MPVISDGSNDSAVSRIQAPGMRRRWSTTTVSAPSASKPCGSTDSFACPSKRPIALISSHRAFVVRNTNASPVRS